MRYPGSDVPSLQALHSALAAFDDIIGRAIEGAGLSRQMHHLLRSWMSVQLEARSSLMYFRTISMLAERSQPRQDERTFPPN